jgi:dTDP-4-amino-4,6-dideoxy-D-galactose acyltransferase
MGTGGVSSERIAARASALAYYSPYFFLRQLPGGLQQELFGTGLAARWGQEPGNEVYASGASDEAAVEWLLQALPWDTAYFGVPTIRLFTGVFAPLPAAALARASAALRQHLAKRYESFYAFSIVPAEDVQLLQALTGAGWRLVETRLTYYRDELSSFDFPRFPVRAAEEAEASRISEVSAACRNPYDRFHADAWFSNAQADAYLARYAENAVTTPLASTVLVPNEPGLPIDSFLAISDLERDAAALGWALSRVLLTAVGAANRGWHLKLVAETVHRAR